MKCFATLRFVEGRGQSIGYDNVLNCRVSESVGIPVIASGGCGAVGDIADAFIEGKASAALAASIFHFGHSTIADAKRQLMALGIPVRLGETT